MPDAIIADIQRASVHDGPGLRTTVFFKGCPLNCEWCHNPECIKFGEEILYYPEKCIHCGKCEEGCFSGAKKICGKKMSIEAVLKQILSDKEYYKDDGGVTFSGGEPLAQKEFLNAIIDECKKNKINCAVETSLIYYDEEIFKKLDFIMADFKIWDTELHKKHTGVDNEIIKKNFIKINKLGIPIIARTPVIPGIEQGIDKISEFLKELENVIKYELLAYHPLGVSKAKALLKEQKKFEIPTKKYMKELDKYAYIR